MVHGATAVTASSQERWSLRWDARTTPSALFAVSAGTQAPLQTHTHTYRTNVAILYSSKETRLHTQLATQLGYVVALTTAPTSCY